MSAFLGGSEKTKLNWNGSGAIAGWLICDCTCAVAQKRGRKVGVTVDYEKANREYS